MLAVGQTTTGGINRDRPRSPYDPGATSSSNGQQQSGVAAALQKINPQDKNYGQMIDEGQITLFEQTVEDFYWWSCMVLTLLLMFAVVYIAWLWRERGIRLSISGDVVAQLYNSYVASRAKALEAIEMHNRLARRYDAKCLELAAVREAEAEKEHKKSRRVDAETAEKLTENPTSETDTNLGAVAVAQAQGLAEEDHRAGMNEESKGAEAEVARLNMMVQNLQAQAKAQNQKISNLRSQLNRAHDQYKIQPNQVRES
jgi:hypothetical protein